MDVRIFFSGSPEDGSQAYPASFKQFATLGDRGAEHPDQIKEIWEFIEGGTARYLYKRFDVLTAKNGRDGAKFCIWIELPGNKIHKDSQGGLIKFLDDLFSQGIVNAINLLALDSTSNKYYFTTKKLDYLSSSLNNIINLAQDQFTLAITNDSLIPIQSHTSSSKDLIDQYRPEKPELPKPEPELFLPEPIILPPPPPDDERDKKYQSLLIRYTRLQWSVLALSMVCILLTIYILIIPPPSSKPLYGSISDQLPSNTTSPPISKPAEPSRVDITLFLEEDRGKVYLKDYPYDDAPSSLQGTTSSIDNVIDFLATQLFDRYRIDTLDIFDTAIDKEKILVTMMKSNPSDISNLNNKLKESITITYKKAIETLLEGENFLIYQK